MKQDGRKILNGSSERGHRKNQTSANSNQPAQNYNLIGKQVPQLASSEAFQKQKLEKKDNNTSSVETRAQTKKWTQVSVITPLVTQGDVLPSDTDTSPQKQVRSNSEAKIPMKSPFKHKSKNEPPTAAGKAVRINLGEETISFEPSSPITVLSEKRADHNSTALTASKLVKTSVRNLLDMQPAVFSTVSMQPEKKAMKGKVISGSANANELIEAATLARILELQKQYRQENYGWLDVSQIGIAGIPSLWMTSAKLIQDKQVPPLVMQNLEKYHKMFVLLRCHRKWEQEKLFGRNSNQHFNNQHNQVDYELFTERRIQSKYKKHWPITDMDLPQGSVNGISAPVPLLTQYSKSFNSQSTYSSIQHSSIGPLMRHEPEYARYQLVQCTSRLLQQILESNQTEPLPESAATQNAQSCSLFWSCNGLNNKPQLYQNLFEHQKVNHFMQSTELTRKDRLVANFMKKRKVHGKGEFNYLPETYELPQQYEEFQMAFGRNERRVELNSLEKQINENSPKKMINQLNDGEFTPKSAKSHMYRDNVWIVKPAQSSRGRGIYLITDLADVPQDGDQERYVISKYISNPLLVSGYKFDLRLYVLVTSIDPLRIYIYNEGLVRFASEPYETGKGSKFSHLTNYSINKNNASFVKNKNAQEQDIGNKWSMSALQTHLKNLGIDLEIMWGKIYDAVLKSLISVESVIFENAKKSQSNSSSCKSNFFELFGYDIMLDSELNPWILEVNLAPSLSADSPIDFHVKSNLIVDMFNLVGIRRMPGKKNLRRMSKPKRQNSGVNNGTDLMMQRYGGYEENGNSPSGTRTTANSSMKNINNQLRGTNLGNQTRGSGGWKAGVSQNKHPSQTNFPDYNSQKKVVNSVIMTQQQQQIQVSMGNTSYPGFGAALAPQAFYEGIEINLLEKISRVSAKHRSVLLEVLSEMERNTRLNFTRIYPAAGTQHYDRFFEAVRPNNRLVYRYLFEKNELNILVNQSCFDDLQPLKHWDETTDFSQQPSTTDVSAMIKRVCDNDDTDKHTDLMESQASEIGVKDLAGQIVQKANDVKLSLKPPSNITMLEEEYDQMLKDRHHEKKRSDYMGPVSPKLSLRPKSQRDELESATTILPMDGQPQTDMKMQSTFANQRSQVGKYNLATEQNHNKRMGADPKLPSLNIEAVSALLLDGKSKDQREIPLSFNLSAKTAIPFANDSKRLENNSFFKKRKDLNERDSPQFRQDYQSNEFPIEESKEEVQILQKYLLNESPLGFMRSNNSSRQKKLPEFQQKKMEEITDREGSKKKKVVITGDDILIEYVRRVKNSMKKISTIVESQQSFKLGPVQHLPRAVINSLEKFSSHKAWLVTGSDMNVSSPSRVTHQSVFETATQLWQKLHVRYIQMKDQRDIVFKKKKSEKSDEYIREARQLIKLRDEIVKSLTSEQLEGMVLKSNSQGPIEIVTLLAGVNQNADGNGNLIVVEKFQKRSQQNQEITTSPMSFGNTVTKNSQVNIKTDKPDEQPLRPAIANKSSQLRSSTTAEFDPYQAQQSAKMPQSTFNQLSKKFQTPQHLQSYKIPAVEQELHAVNSAQSINNYWTNKSKIKIKTQKQAAKDSTIQQTLSQQRFFEHNQPSVNSLQPKNTIIQTLHPLMQGPATPQKKPYTKVAPIQSILTDEASKNYSGHERVLEQRRATEKHISQPHLTNIIQEVHDQITDKNLSRQIVGRTNTNITQHGMLQKQSTDGLSRQNRVFKHTTTVGQQTKIRTEQSIISQEIGENQTSRQTRVRTKQKMSLSVAKKVHLPNISNK